MLKRFPIAVLMLAFLVSCSSAKVLKSEVGDVKDLNQYKSFDFYQIEAKGDTASQVFAERIQLLEDAISLEMQKKGYLLSKTNPDILVNIGIVVNEEVQTRQTDFRTDAPRYIGQRRYSWKSQEVEVGRYREGTVSLDLVDRKENRMIWEAAVQDVIPRSEAKVEKAVKRGVKAMFAKFPGKARE